MVVTALLLIAVAFPRIKARLPYEQLTAKYAELEKQSKQKDIYIAELKKDLDYQQTRREVNKARYAKQEKLKEFIGYRNSRNDDTRPRVCCVECDASKSTKHGRYMKCVRHGEDKEIRVGKFGTCRFAKKKTN